MRQRTWVALTAVWLAAQASAAAPVAGPEAFRDLFLGGVSRPLSRDQAALPVYLAPEALLRAPAGRTADELLDALGARFRDVLPAELHRFGADRRATAVEAARSKALLRQVPVTVVIVPGIFSEFIAGRAFEEVFSLESSTFHRQYRRALAAAAGTADATDSHHSLAHSPRLITRVTKPLGELVNVASIDDTDGTPLVRAILFRTPRLSLETLRSLRDNSEEFLRRLEKLFRVLGETPENLVFVGYSPGTPVALDMLSVAKERNAAWLPRVKGMVALGGVTFGSDLADETRRRGSSMYQTIQLAKQLRNDLQTIPEGAKWWQATQIFGQNLDAFRRFGVGLGQANADPAVFRSLATTLTSTVRRDEGTDLQSSAQIAAALAREFGLHEFFKGFSDNVVRFRRFIDEVLVAVDGLTTAERKRWWSGHVVPSQGIRYYAVAGTMVDPRDDATLAGNPVCYNPRLFDYKMLLQNYRDFRGASGFAVNDSQVAMHKVIFWPELVRELNPRQDPIEASFLGVVGTHHWGLALPIVTQMRNASLRDPFPRAALLQAIAGSVALDLGGRL